MVQEIPPSTEFEVHRKRALLASCTRKQLEDEVIRLTEWDALKKTQLNNALGHIGELEARAAIGDPDPLARWSDMASRMKSSPLYGEDGALIPWPDQAATASAASSS